MTLGDGTVYTAPNSVCAPLGVGEGAWTRRSGSTTVTSITCDQQCCGCYCCFSPATQMIISVNLSLPITKPVSWSDDAWRWLQSVAFQTVIMRGGCNIWCGRIGSWVADGTDPTLPAGFVAKIRVNYDCDNTPIGPARWIISLIASAPTGTCTEGSPAVDTYFPATAGNCKSCAGTLWNLYNGGGPDTTTLIAVDNNVPHNTTILTGSASLAIRDNQCCRNPATGCVHLTGVFGSGPSPGTYGASNTDGTCVEEGM